LRLHPFPIAIIQGKWICLASGVDRIENGGTSILDFDIICTGAHTHNVSFSLSLSLTQTNNTHTDQQQGQPMAGIRSVRNRHHLTMALYKVTRPSICFHHPEAKANRVCETRHSNTTDVILAYAHAEAMSRSKPVV
jgi:hypothetical protein